MLAVALATLILFSLFPLSSMGARLCCLSPCKESWSGSYVNRRKHGSGIYHASNGDVYEGEYNNDRRHGSGTQRWADGSCYDGEWRDDRQHGHGTYKAPTRDTHTPHHNQHAAAAAAADDAIDDSHHAIDAHTASYTGQWRNGVKSGQGTLVYTDGAVYTGQFAADVPSGHGELARKDGSCYVGEWREGRWDGPGVWTRVNGDVVEGRFVKGRAEGSGRMVKYCGDEVRAEWVSGVMRGQGEIRRRVQREEGDERQQKLRHRKPTIPSPLSNSPLSLPSQHSTSHSRSSAVAGAEDEDDTAAALPMLLYKGDVLDGDMHGWGTLYWDNGDTCYAQYRRGCGLTQQAEVGERVWCVYTYSDGGRWEGDMKGRRRDGNGTMQWKDGRTYSGQYVDDKRHGVGTYEDESGLYSGGWQDDKKEGEGVMEWRDGRRYEGAFVNGEQHGSGVVYYTPLTPHITPTGEELAVEEEEEDMFVSDFSHDQPLAATDNIRLASLRLLQHRIFHLKVALQQLQTEQSAIDPATLCVVCMERRRCILLLDCRHMAVCEVCAAGTDDGSSGTTGWIACMSCVSAACGTAGDCARVIA